MSEIEQALAYAREHQASNVEGLKELVRIPSISSKPEHAKDMQRAADWLVDWLRRAGIPWAEVFATEGHPVVLGEVKASRPAAPTVLVYGHYDVQPVEPLADWRTTPFEPEQQGDNLYGRGVSDMKGQFMAAIAAVEAALSTGSLPVNVKFVLEGEEEIGSSHLPALLSAQRERLACDVALNLDAGMVSPEHPTVVYGLRGSYSCRLKISGPTVDLHSGLFGGVVQNPIHVMSELIASLHAPDGHVTLPGFYDAVREISAEEHALLSQLPMDEEFFRVQTGVPATWGEKQFLPVERIGARPTMEVTFFQGGEPKGAIPASATANFSMRLVPDQDPAEIHRLFMRYLETTLPPTIRWEVLRWGGAQPALAPLDTPYVQAFREAFGETWGTPVVFTRIGGSIPIVTRMKEILGIESILSGFYLPDDGAHGPNEKLHLPTWARGVEALVRFLYRLGSD